MASKPYTPDQLRAFHAEGKKRGLTHEDLREFAGVTSLKMLDRESMRAAIDRLKGDRPEPAGTRRRPPGVIRNASRVQRDAIFGKAINQLGWSREKLNGWLLKRHGIKDLYGDAFTSRTASNAITQLEQAIKREETRSPVDVPF